MYFATMSQLLQVIVYGRNISRTFQYCALKRSSHLCLSRNLTSLTRSNLKQAHRPVLPVFHNTNQLRLLKNNRLDRISSVGLRLFSSKDDSDSDNRPPEEEAYNTQLPATVAVPEVWPHVPVIAINRNIVFPRFIKLIEVLSSHVPVLTRVNHNIVF